MSHICCLQRCICCCKIWGIPEISSGSFPLNFFHFSFKKNEKYRTSWHVIGVGTGYSTKPSSSCWVFKWWSWVWGQTASYVLQWLWKLLFLCPPASPLFSPPGSPELGLAGKSRIKLAWMSTVHKSYPSTARLLFTPGSAISNQGRTCFCLKCSQVLKNAIRSRIKHIL